MKSLDHGTPRVNLRPWLGPVLGGLALLIALYLASTTTYLLFHGVAEVFAIVISAAVFTLAWNTRRWQENQFLLFVGIALLASSLLTALHLLTYKGMGIFQDDANLPTQFWLARRYVEAAALLVAPYFITQRTWPGAMLLGFGGLTGLLLLAIGTGTFPAAYVEGSGLTPFKVVSEYVIALLFMLAAVQIYRHRDHFEPETAAALIAAAVLSAFSELLFTLYIGVYDLPNRFGHFTVLVATFLVYRAIVRNNLMRPYELLSAANASLSAEIAEREQAQEALRRQSQAVRASREQMRMLSHRLVEVQEEERKNLSRELHDRAGQTMTSLKLGLDVLQRQVAGSEALESRVDGLLRMADAVMEELHDLAISLRPSVLDRLGLLPALEQLATGFRQQSGVEIVITENGVEGARLPGDLETMLYRIVQESLTNVARHAAATKVSLTLTRRTGHVRLELADNGRGFDVEAALQRGRLGLLGMRERAEMAGGALTVESAPGQGSRVCVEAPVRGRVMPND